MKDFIYEEARYQGFDNRPSIIRRSMMTNNIEWLGFGSDGQIIWTKDNPFLFYSGLDTRAIVKTFNQMS